MQACEQKINMAGPWAIAKRKNQTYCFIWPLNRKLSTEPIHKQTTIQMPNQNR